MSIRISSSWGSLTLSAKFFFLSYFAPIFCKEKIWFFWKSNRFFKTNFDKTLTRPEYFCLFFLNYFWQMFEKVNFLRGIFKFPANHVETLWGLIWRDSKESRSFVSLGFFLLTGVRFDKVLRNCWLVSDFLSPYF